ncbi:MAG: DUF4114 domain-containing protein, partial [Cyanobacteria bacterium SBLK]|nr:DUF4114 domain-containing protein [Cyanobacteria bacterium SBLK]
LTGARFSGNLGEKKNWNSGTYSGPQTSQMNPGDRFGLMFVGNGTVKQVLEGKKTPLFSLETANPDDIFHVGQIAGVMGEGGVFAMEDLRPEHRWFDGDYNDVIFQVTGAIGTANPIDDLILKDWRGEPLWETIMTELSI